VGSVASVMFLNVTLMTWLCGYMNEVVFCGSHSALDVQMVEVRSLICLGSL